MVQIRKTAIILSVLILLSIISFFVVIGVIKKIENENIPQAVFLSTPEEEYSMQFIPTPDSDMDGIPDEVEELFGYNKMASDSSGDDVSDLQDLVERSIAVYGVSFLHFEEDLNESGFHDEIERILGVFEVENVTIIDFYTAFAQDLITKENQEIQPQQ